MLQRFQRFPCRGRKVINAGLHWRRIGCLCDVCIWKSLQNPRPKVYGGVGIEIIGDRDIGAGAWGSQGCSNRAEGVEG